MGSCFSGPLMTFSPILTLDTLVSNSSTPDANMWHLAAKCSTTHQLTNFVSLSFSAGQAAYMAFIRAFPLKIAACCMWKQSWWALWEWTRLLKLWVIKAKTIRRTKDAKPLCGAEGNYGVGVTKFSVGSLLQAASFTLLWAIVYIKIVISEALKCQKIVENDITSHFQNAEEKLNV